MKHFHSLLLLVLIFILPIGKVNAQLQPPDVIQANERNLFGISMYGGVSLPTGPLGATKGAHAGSAKAGYALGVDGDVRLLDYASWMTSANLSVNNFQIDPLMHTYGIVATSTPWTTVWALTGVKASISVADHTELFCFGQGGLLYGSGPEISYAFFTNRMVQTVGSATTLGYGFGGGIVYNRLMVNARYLSGEPEYKSVTTDGHTSYTTKIKQPTAAILVTAGFAF